MVAKIVISKTDGNQYEVHEYGHIQGQPAYLINFKTVGRKLWDLECNYTDAIQINRDVLKGIINTYQNARCDLLELLDLDESFGNVTLHLERVHLTGDSYEINGWYGYKHYVLDSMLIIEGFGTADIFTNYTLSI